MINIGIGIPFGQRSAGIDPQAKIAFDSLQSAGFTTPQGITGINAAFKTIKTIYGTSDITTAISFFGDPSLAYQIGAGSGTTLGQAIRTLPNIIDPTRATDAVQTTAASQPLLLTHTTGNNYWWGSGVANNFVSTPNAAANNFGGAIDIKLLIKPAQLGVVGILTDSAEGQGGNGYSFQITSGNNLRFGSATFGVNSSVSLSNINQIWVRVTSTGNLGTITFYTSTDGINWTTGGTGTDGTRGASTSILAIGSRNNGSNPFTGRILRCTISNQIDGTPLVDFNPNQYNPSTSQTQWTSSTGEVWSLNVGTATSGYKGVLVDRTLSMADGVDDRLVSTLNRPNTLTQYLAANPLTNGAAGDNVVIDGNSGAWNNSIVAYSGFMRNIMNGFGSNLSRPRTDNRSILITSVNDAGVKNSLNINNGAEITNAYTPSPSGNGLNIFTRSGGATRANAIVTTYICAAQSDNASIQTSMYNYIRSINNAAF